VVDVTAPTVTVTAPTAGQRVPLGAPLVAQFSCADAESGIGSCTGTVANGAAISTATLGSFTFTVGAVDRAGNTTRRSVTYDVVDTAPPRITVTAPVDGARIPKGDPATASYTCTDPETGIASCTAVVVDQGAIANGGALPTGTLGHQVLRVDASDNAGNTASREVAYDVVDVTPPTVVISSPPAGNPAVLLGETSLRGRYSCSDEEGGSGVVRCAGPVTNGSSVPASSPGQQAFTVDAADAAGNVGTATATYRVLPYRFDGFVEPTVVVGTTTQAAAGAPVVVRWTMHDANGAAVTDPKVMATPVVQTVSCATGQAVGTTSPAKTVSGVIYNQALAEFELVWQTDTAWTGTCQQLKLRFAGSISVRSAQFRFV
jgi:hypothetical protein